MGVVAGGDFLQRGAIDFAGRIERHGVKDDDLLRRLVANARAGELDQVAGLRPRHVRLELDIGPHVLPVHEIVHGETPALSTAGC